MLVAAGLMAVSAAFFLLDGDRRMALAMSCFAGTIVLLYAGADEDGGVLAVVVWALMACAYVLFLSPLVL